MVQWSMPSTGKTYLFKYCGQDRLIESTEAISLRLEYFQELEHATRMLNHPGESLVLQTDFLLMVERVDVCLEYLEAHVSNRGTNYCCPCGFLLLGTQRNFREAEIYLLRFQQCLTRAMTLIKMYFVGSLKALTADIQRRLSEKVRVPCDLHPNSDYLRLYFIRMYQRQLRRICSTQSLRPHLIKLHPFSQS